MEPFDLISIGIEACFFQERENLKSRKVWNCSFHLAIEFEMRHNSVNGNEIYKCLIHPLVMKRLFLDILSVQIQL